jgi:cell shape-determining protein MreC
MDIKPSFNSINATLHSIINNNKYSKMNKIKLLFIFIAFLSFSGINAQMNPEKKARKLTDEMTSVLSLNEEESKAIYEIQLNRFKESQSIQKEYADNPEQKKEQLKKLGDKAFNQIKNVLGTERQKKWKEHKSNSK